MCVYSDQRVPSLQRSTEDVSACWGNYQVSSSATPQYIETLISSRSIHHEALGVAYFPRECREKRLEMGAVRMTTCGKTWPPLYWGWVPLERPSKQEHLGRGCDSDRHRQLLFVIVAVLFKLFVMAREAHGNQPRIVSFLLR